MRPGNDDETMCNNCHWKVRPDAETASEVMCVNTEASLKSLLRLRMTTVKRVTDAGVSGSY